MRQTGKELSCSRSHGHHVVFPGVSCFLCKELDKIISEMHTRTQLQNFIILRFHVVRLLLPPGSVSSEPVTFLCDSWVFEARRGTFYNATVSVHGQVSLTAFHPWASTDWARACSCRSRCEVSQWGTAFVLVFVVTEQWRRKRQDEKLPLRWLCSSRSSKKTQITVQKQEPVRGV